MDTHRVNAIVPAGSGTKAKDSPESLENICGVSNKALIAVSGKILVEYVVDALKGCKFVDKIVVVGPVGDLAPALHAKVEQIIPPRDSMLDNAVAGVEALPLDVPTLVVTADAPLLTPSHFDWLVSTCRDQDAKIFWPIINKIQNEEKFPGTKRTYVRLNEGTFTGGNFILCDPAIFLSHRELLLNVVAARKSPLNLFRILGFAFVLKFLLTQLGIPVLTIADLEKRIGEILGGIKVKGVLCPDPEVGIDVDKVEDLEMVRQVLKSSK